MNTENKKLLKNFKDMAASGKLSQWVSVTEKIAKNCTEEEFVDFLQKSEVPAIKLTKKEMEIVSGGLVWYAVLGACIAVGMAAEQIYGAGKAFYDGYKGNAKGTN